MEIDLRKRQEWETHIHFFTFKELIDMFCKYLKCEKDSTTYVNVYRYLEKEVKNITMFALWMGHIKGDYYGNFSLRSNGEILQMKRGFHCRKEWFNFVMDLPLDWHDIIDCTMLHGVNNAQWGIDLKTGEFLSRTEVLPIDVLSKQKY